MPLNRRLPKKGFSNAKFRTEYAVVNLSSLEAKFEDGATIDEAALRAAGLVQGGAWDGVKVLAMGDLTKKFTVQVDKVSAAAQEKIEKAGGSVTDKQAAA